MDSSRSSAVPTKRLRLNGILVTLSEPEDPSGLTFLIPGAMLSESSYMSTRQVLHHEQNQAVISFYVNVFTKSHDTYVNDVARIYDAYCCQRQQDGCKPFHRYNIVGHSVGGKIALLCTTVTTTTTTTRRSVAKDNNIETNNRVVSTVLALDPVDDRPPEFTNTDRGKNRSLLRHHAATVILTHAAATRAGAIPDAHNAAAIAATASHRVRLIDHPGAAHMAYTDNNGGPMGWMMRGGTPEGNKAAREDAQTLIRHYIR